MEAGGTRRGQRQCEQTTKKTCLLKKGRRGRSLEMRGTFWLDDDTWDIHTDNYFVLCTRLGVHTCSRHRSPPGSLSTISCSLANTQRSPKSNPEPARRPSASSFEEPSHVHPRSVLPPPHHNAQARSPGPDVQVDGTILAPPLCHCQPARRAELPRTPRHATIRPAEFLTVVVAEYERKRKDGATSTICCCLVVPG